VDEASSEVGSDGEGEVAARGSAVGVAENAGERGWVGRWAGVPGEGGDGEAGRVVEAGGSAGLAGDAAAIARVAADGDGGAGGVVRVAVRGWEPPTLEAMDFVRELRAGIGGGVIEVVAVFVDGAGPTRGAQLGAWGRAVERLGDGDVRLVAREMGGAISEGGVA
ncbi:MAG: DUF2868 domain-containing protein, partial [Planctomycetota bacterium]